jgi:ABC-type amino acid transport substrate-binding protein
MNNEEKLSMTIMSGKDHAESFLLVETGRVSAWMEDDILIAGFRANAKNPADFSSEGAAGSIVENISKLECTIDPNEIKKKDGVGAECTFERGQ